VKAIRAGRSAVAGVVVAGLLAAGCSGSNEPGSALTREGGPASPLPIGPVRGEHITVVLPSYANPPKELISAFERESGAAVSVDTASWDDVHDRIVTAEAAGHAAGDVTEVDWSWVGQFGQAGWYTPLEASLPAGVLADLDNTSTFTHGGHVLAACYNNDVRIGAYNKQLFAKAGIGAPPVTIDELRDDLATLQSSGVSAHPLALAAAATEGSATLWYLLTKVMGGELLDAKGQPAFTNPGSGGYRALAFEVEAVRRGWAAPSAPSTTDVQADALFTGGQAAVQLAGNPGELSVANDPSQSKVAGQVEYFLEPGLDKTGGPGPTYGLPEGLGIPKASAHKAAALAFIAFMTRPEVGEELFAGGTLPCRRSAVHALSAAGRLAGGPTIEQEIGHVTPLFRGGPPPWYPKFSTEVAAQVNAAVKGEVTVATAIERLAGTVRRLASGG
jgi:multiple sugar transport system substrate-binding protein